MGFSERHLSLVANIRNLSTSFISPQFHIIHDNRFHTVTNMDHVQAITDENTPIEIFERGKEDYSEYDYDEKNKLLYEPPPMAQRWLSDPEQRGQKDRAKRYRGPSPKSQEEERLECNEDAPVDFDLAPDLEESDVESDSEGEDDGLLPILRQPSPNQP